MDLSEALAQRWLGNNLTAVGLCANFDFSAYLSEELGASSAVHFANVED